MQITTTGAPPKVALYFRVSTPSQDEGLQVHALRQEAARRGWEVVEEYVDHASGAKDSRPALNKLLADAKAGRFQVVAVWRFDRAARSLRMLISLLETLAGLGIDFVSTTEAVDTTTPAGRAMFQMIAVFSEFERAVLRGRVKAGLEKAKAQGRKLGRPARATKAQIDRAATLRAEGASWRSVAQSVGLPVRTLRRALAVAETCAA